MYDTLQTEIVEDLTTELEGEDDFSATLLAIKVKIAVLDVASARNYPSTYSETIREEDLTDNYYTQIRAIALYDYSKIGAEGQDNYTADGENIKYSDRQALFEGILPMTVF